MIKMSLALISSSIFTLVTLSAEAGSTAKSNDLINSLTVGVTPLPELIESGNGLYRADGVAEIVSEDNFRTADSNLAKNLKNSESKKDTSIVIAREYLKLNASKYGLNTDDIDELKVTDTRLNETFSVVRFEQRINDVPVYGSEIAVTVTYDGKVTFVASNTVTGLAKIKFSTGKFIEKEKAIEVAKKHLGVARLSSKKAELVIFKAEDLRQYDAWQVKLIPKDGPKGDWEIIIDAVSGKILRSENRVMHAKGTAKVYKTDPLAFLGKKYGIPGLVDNTTNPTSANTAQSPTDSPELTSARVAVTLEDITLKDGNYSLAGLYAVCSDFEPPTDSACPVQNKQDFDFTRTHVSFDGVNAYYAIDSYMRYVNEALNVKVMPYQYKGGVQFDPHGLNGDDNSHFIPSTGRVAFGQGGVDDAEDVAVVIHELGHGIHDWLTRGNAGNDGQNGIGEGTGDYLAAGYLRDKQESKWKPTDTEYQWVMRWDGHNPFWGGRVTNWNVGRTYPKDVVNTGSPHTAGQYWSSCNMAARDRIGAKEMDKVFLNGLSKTVRTTNQKGAAQAIIDAAKDMKYTQDQINKIAEAYNTACTYGVTVPKALDPIEGE
ncbi:PepSY domain-containing protein [Fluviispira sanaruensis]|uniref:Peptidase n=1 Tax=Fluviispira sanaruensis TaxID=2493639 RepID=A0A4V0P277_FLUSA|nr:PepSY domain-containing protein [Fluviispira sanaruensis]BBH52267.1 peptidase [Fluviispira sanaruensis]